jgi:hypothetical protein
MPNSSRALQVRMPHMSCVEQSSAKPGARDPLYTSTTVCKMPAAVLPPTQAPVLAFHRAELQSPAIINEEHCDHALHCPVPPLLASAKRERYGTSVHAGSWRHSSAGCGTLVLLS